VYSLQSYCDGQLLPPPRENADVQMRRNTASEWTPQGIT
jgi:hypothetical protein